MMGICTSFLQEIDALLWEATLLKLLIVKYTPQNNEKFAKWLHQDCYEAKCID